MLAAAPDMNPCPKFLRVSALCGLLVASGHASGLDRLRANSPFAPVPGGKDNAPAATPLEFRGVFMDQGELFFSVFNPVAKSSVWVGLNEPGQAFTVRSFDADTQTITAEHNGRSLVLGLKKAPVAALAPDATGPAVRGAAPGATAVTAANATEEAKRLANLAAEIRRRRAMRQQTGTPTTNAAPAPTRQD